MRLVTLGVGYRIRAEAHTLVWAPEFSEFPRWARGADVMFAEGAAWDHPIRFAGSVGGHMDVLAVAYEVGRFEIGRLVLAHIGRPTLRALARGARPHFGEVAADRQSFIVTSGASAPHLRRTRLPRRAMDRGRAAN